MIIGLTGGIATGKSTVSKILQDLDIKVIDADKIAHNILKYKDIKNQIINEFGHNVLDSEGYINRKKLGKIVFEDEQKLRKLESITHPKILEIIEDKINKHKDKEIIVLDAPLLFESTLDQMVDETWVVYTSKEIQLKRLQKRNGLNKEDALKRIEAQMPLEKKKNKADIIIENEGTINDLKKKIEKLVEKRR